MSDAENEGEGLGTYETLQCAVSEPYVAQLQLARPKKSNALNSKAWRELPQVPLTPVAACIQLLWR